MSYTYLRHSRRPSQRAAPPVEDASIEALLDPTSPTSHTLVRTQILTNTHPSPLTIAEQAHTTEEPLPNIDYNLLSLLIRLVHAQLDNHSKKRYDYLIEARRYYYVGHAKFQEAFREMQDANAYGIILQKQSEQIDPTLATGAENETTSPLPSQITPLERARRANNEDLRHLLLTVRHCAQVRDHATSWLSSLKWKFLQVEMPPLIRYAEELHAHFVGGGKDAPPFIGTLPPIMHLEPDASQRLGLTGSGGGVPVVQEDRVDGEIGDGSAGAGAGMAELVPTLIP